MRRRGEAGFTILELVVVGAVFLGLLIGATLLLQPQDYTAARRQAERRTDIARIIQGLARYRAATGGLPEGLPVTPTVVSTEEGGIDLCRILVPMYLKDLPLDPLQGLKLGEDDIQTDKPCHEKGVEYTTGYTIMQKEGRVTLAAPGEDAAGVSITY